MPYSDTGPSTDEARDSRFRAWTCIRCAKQFAYAQQTSGKEQVEEHNIVSCERDRNYSHIHRKQKKNTDEGVGEKMYQNEGQQTNTDQENDSETTVLAEGNMTTYCHA